MASKSINLPIDEEPRLVLKKELSNSKMYQYNHGLVFGCMTPDKNKLVILSLPFRYLNPSSEKTVEELAVGDLINCHYVLTKDESELGLPDELNVKDPIVATFTVSEIKETPMNSVAVICTATV